MKKRLHLRQGITLVELLVVITIILVLAGVLVPISRGIMAKSRTLNCSKNMRQIGTASMMYAADHNMTLPTDAHLASQSWTITLQAILQPYSNELIAFKCQDDKNKSRARTYMINDFLTPNPSGADHLNFSILAKIKEPENTLFFAEATATQRGDHFHFADYYGGRVPAALFENQVATRAHGNVANYLFADGHVETLTRQEVLNRLSKRGTRFADPSAGDPYGY